MKTVLVTGASGFIGKRIVRILNKRGIKVKAGIHSLSHENIFCDLKNVEPVHLDILSLDSINNAIQNVDSLFHFAALVSSHHSREKLNNINALGTRNIWEIAVENNVTSALYCSTTAVYGLLSKIHEPVDEKVIPKAIEAYGYSKLLGENEALKISANHKIKTLIIRPVAVFGPDEHTPFGKTLRRAAISQILLAGTLQKKHFNFVHVDDVAEASYFLMESNFINGEIFNIAVDTPILFEDAFQSYLRIIKDTDIIDLKAKFIAHISSFINNHSVISKMIKGRGKKGLFFIIGQNGFDIQYSAKKLSNSSFHFRWPYFEDILLNCLTSQHD